MNYEQRRMRLHVGAQGIEIAPAVRAYIKGQLTWASEWLSLNAETLQWQND
jgi:hypothetical protein